MPPSVLPYFLGVGLLLSLYTLHINFRVLSIKNNSIEEEQYQPLCQMKTSFAHFDCLGTFAMKEGYIVSYMYDNFFGDALGSSYHDSFGSSVISDPPNSLLGVIYYVIMICLTFAADPVDTPPRRSLAGAIRLALSSAALILTVFLASALYRDGLLCILCVGIHIVNTTVFVSLVLDDRSKIMDERSKRRARWER